MSDMNRPDPHQSASIWKRDGVRREYSWLQWCRSTGANPGMDYAEWLKVWDSANPAPPDPPIDFKPTHVLRLIHPGGLRDPFPIMLLSQDEHSIQYIREYSPGDYATCGDPIWSVRSLHKIIEDGRPTLQDYIRAVNRLNATIDIFADGPVEVVATGAWVTARVFIADVDAQDHKKGE